MNYKDVHSPTFKELIEKDSFVLIDVRTPEEFSKGHLKNSINIDFYDEAFGDIIDELEKRQKYLVYCHSGNRSRQTMFLMRDLGFEEVYNLAGGIISWSEQGFQIIK